MFSGDGEYIDFIHSVLLEGPVEVSCGKGLRIELILFSIRKFAWLCEERTSLRKDISYFFPSYCLFLKTITSTLNLKTNLRLGLHVPQGP